MSDFSVFILNIVLLLVAQVVLVPLVVFAIVGKMIEIYYGTRDRLTKGFLLFEAPFCLHFQAEERTAKVVSMTLSVIIATLLFGLVGLVSAFNAVSFTSSLVALGW